jgi:hypothetical protein
VVNEIRKKAPNNIKKENVTDFRSGSRNALIVVEAALKNEVPEAGCGDCGDFALFDLGFFFTMYGVLFVYRRVKK